MQPQTPPATRGKRLDAEQARAIAERIAAGERHTAIAERFGVSVETVGAIKSGTSVGLGDRRGASRPHAGGAGGRGRARRGRRSAGHGCAGGRALGALDRRGVRHQPQHGERDQARPGVERARSRPAGAPGRRTATGQGAHRRAGGPDQADACSTAGRRARWRPSSASRRRPCARSRRARRGRRSRPGP